VAGLTAEAEAGRRRESAVDAVRKMQRASVANKRDQLADDEIDEEIRAARRERA